MGLARAFVLLRAASIQWQRDVRILALVTDAFGGYGGIAQYNRDLLTALAASSNVNEIVVLPRLVSGEFDNLPAKVRQRDPQILRSAYVACSIRAARQDGPFDAIFSGHIYHTPLAAGLGRWLRIPVWLQTHGIDAWECPSRLVRNAVEQCALITTVSRYTKCRLLAWADVEPERVRVLSNTFRPMFTEGPKDTGFLEQIGLGGCKIILTVSRLSKDDYYKGHTKIIRILPRVLKDHPNAMYVIVGDGDSRLDLEQEVARSGLEAAVRFVGRLTDDDVLRLYRSANVFAMPSSKEGFGIVFVEAAATGLPVIGGNRDGSTDALADGVIGKMIDPDDDGALADALIAALAEAVKADTSAVQRFAFENFSRHVDDLARSLAH